MDLIKVNMVCPLSCTLCVPPPLYAVSGLFNLQIEEVNYIASLFHFSLINIKKDD